MELFSVGKRLDVGLSRLSSIDHIKYVNYVYPYTMCARVSEVVEAIGQRHINTCCVQEAHWKGCSARLISAKGFKCKFMLEQRQFRFWMCWCLRWLVGLKLIYTTWTTKNTVSSHYFSKKIKANTLQGHRRYIKIFKLEINNLFIQILGAKLMQFHLKNLPFVSSKSLQN